MYLPISETLIRRMLSLARVTTYDEGVRVLVPYPQDVFLVDKVGEYISRSIRVSLNAHGKYDLIMLYSPLPFNQEQETVTEYYSMLKTNGRLLCTALDASLKAKKETQERFVRWLRNLEACMEDLPYRELEMRKGSLLIIDRLEIVTPEILRPKILRTAKYRG